LNLIKITDLVNQLGLSSRSLRYYEQVGLIKSVRPQFEKYRFYDEQAIERLGQIIVLRKMQIPVKDILRIYENEDMTTVVEVFVERINALDEQVGALSEMKRIVGEFLKAMTARGITKISALPLLYEEMDKELTILEEQKPVVNESKVTIEDLNAVSKKLAKPVDFAIVDLPPMRVLTSFLKPDTKESDFAGFLRYIQLNGLSQTTSGNHRQFEFQTEAGDVLMVGIPDDFVNDSKYSK
jgi:DNA-binding transcriptional MerR regulator